MKMLIHASSRNKIVDHLTGLIQNNLPEIQVESVASDLHLTNILNRPLNNVTILISVVKTSSDIQKLNSLRPLFSNAKQILILPHRSRQMVESGLQMAPSYISYHDSNLKDVFSVVEKIYQKRKRSP